ncbi:hypothetical protein K474DRAFT_1657465 [Panus rudis PR-1116 ss-1]|nr:hypothetical protein K474DRAFT_1657465 [Panus rudis PR-1116 ss-1]
MSSWSASAYPPPRGRSRSRSPYRGGSSYPPPRSGYPDSGYPQDPYRSDWDAYDRDRDRDRDRAWAYERERSAYDYGRRGRSRSPPPDEVGRKRRRSLSPWERDRYEPRPRHSDDYDTHSRSHGYGSPPPRGQYPPPPYGSSRRAPPDPHTFDYPATLKQYAEWFRYYYPQQAIEEDNADKAAEQEAGDGSKPRNGIRARWEKYRKEFAAQQLQRMFEHHRKSPWFAEKYDPSPEFVRLRARVRRVGWRGRMDTFLLDLEAGKFDPDLTQPQPNAESEPTSPAKENTSNGETKANGAETKETPAEESKPAATGGDDEMQFNVDNEDEGDQDGNRSKQTDEQKRANKTGEEVSIQPEGNQVMIRTIPPDIGRVKLEEAISKIPGFVYLALGDPMQKRNYYRAGWIRFRDDADMTSVLAELSEKKIEGFKLHVAHITKPFTSRTRYTPEAASRPDRTEKDLANAKALARILEDEYVALLKAKAEAKAKAESTEQSADANGTSQDAPATELGDDQEEDPEPRERGSDAVERRIEKVISDMKEHGLFEDLDENEVQAKRTVISLDLYLAYLRSAFNTCYYCAVVTDHVEELHRKCVKHVRKPLSKVSEPKIAEVKTEQKDGSEGDAMKVDEDKEKEKDAPKEKATEKDTRDWKRNDDRWLEWLDSKIALLINRNGVDPRDYGGKSYDEELSRACEPHIKQEDEGKFRCKTCQKLFKAPSFVEKHIANKHPELVKHLEELPYFNNFALDPHHIQPFSHPPAQVGTSQPPPPQAYGLQGPAYPLPPAEYGRPPYHPPYGAYPPPYPNGHYDPYAAPFYPPPFPPPRRDELVTARRLSDRISGFAPGYEPAVDVPITIPASAGLPAKPAVTMDTTVPIRRGSRNGGGPSGPPPPPPPDAKEDPRAAAGKKVSYHDMDLVAEGDVELTY